MRITLESTTQIVKLNGIDCRIWEGETEKGIGVYCFIPRVAVRKEEDCSQLEAELQEQPRAPSAYWPLRMVL